MDDVELNRCAIVLRGRGVLDDKRPRGTNSSTHLTNATPAALDSAAAEVESTVAALDLVPREPTTAAAGGAGSPYVGLEGGCGAGRLAARDDGEDGDAGLAGATMLEAVDNGDGR